MRRTLRIVALLGFVTTASLAACATDDTERSDPEPAARTLTPDEIAQMCLDLCREASYCNRLDDVGGGACEAECAEALLAQDYDTVAVWSCMDWAGVPDRCDELGACLEGVPPNASCARGCAALEACGAYPYFGNMDSLGEMPPIEAVCGRWCDGQVAFGANAELEDDFACYASALEDECNAFELFACSDDPSVDCATACASVDECLEEARGAYGSSAACEAHCESLGGGRALFADCVAGGESCDPAVDPGCGEGCADTTHCEELPETPSLGCLRACDDALALCDPEDEIGAQLCAWTCAREEIERPEVGATLAACMEEQEACIQAPLGDGSTGRWGATIEHCWRELE